MRRAGSKSWRLSTSKNPAANFCLYIRDAFGLDLIGSDIPPPLSGDVPLIELESLAADQLDLALAWHMWWRRLIRVVGAAQLGRGLDSLSREDYRRAHLEAHQSIFDPLEDFESLREYPALRSAAQRSWPQGYEWSKTHASPRFGPSSTGHRSPTPKMVAERVIEERHVSPERVKAAVIVLEVEGKWCHLATPGTLLCSEELFFDDASFSQELKITFESGLADETN